MKRSLVFLLVIVSFRLVYSQPYFLENKITGLPVITCFDFLPDGNVIINQQNGNCKIYSLNNTLISNFWTFSDSISTGGECGLIGVCLDPLYSINHYLYFYYIRNTGAY